MSSLWLEMMQWWTFVKHEYRQPTTNDCKIEIVTRFDTYHFCIDTIQTKTILKISSNKNNWEQKITLLLYYTKYWLVYLILKTVRRVYYIKYWCVIYVENCVKGLLHIQYWCLIYVENCVKSLLHKILVFNLCWKLCQEFIT